MERFHRRPRAFSRGLPKEVAAVQIRVNKQVVYEQAYLAKGGQFQADAVEQSSLHCAPKVNRSPLRSWTKITSS